MEDDSATSIWASLNSWFTSTVFFILLNLMIATIFFTSNLPNNNNNHQHHHKQEQEKEEQKQNTQIARSTSILNRLKSFNFLPDISHQESEETDHHQQQQPLQVAATQYVFNQPLDYQHFNYHFDSTGSDPHTETHVVWEHQQTEITHFDFDPTREEIRPESGFEDAHEHEEQSDGFQSLDEVYCKLKTGPDRTKSEGDLPPKQPVKMKKSASLKVGFVAHLEEEEEEEVVEARRPVTVRERKSARRMMDHDDVEVDSKADDFINKFKNDLKLQRIESILRTKGATGRGAEK